MELTPFALGAGCAAAKRWRGRIQVGATGLVSGKRSFPAELLAQVSERQGRWHYGAEWVESAPAKAERLLAKELARLGWAEADLALRRKGDRLKVSLAAKLRAQTTMTLEWIANRLQMGTHGHLTHLLYRYEHTTSDATQGQLWQPHDNTID